MTGQNLNEEGLLDPRFIDKTYQEALALTKLVAHFFEQKNDQILGRHIAQETQVFYASESMRVSACLMQVVSWFLVQKGVSAGEITKQEASYDKYRLGGREVCLARVNVYGAELPEKFIEYHNQARKLYSRVERMDQMVYGTSRPENPVHKLFSRLEKDHPPEGE